MTQPIGPPQTTYNQPPDGKLPAYCPHCNAQLTHFLTTPAETAQIPEPQLIRTPELAGKKADDAVKKDVAVKQAQAPAAATSQHPTAKTLVNLDDPRIGGRLTICVLLYGEFHNLHRRCLNSIVETLPPSRMELRVACNQVCAETVHYLESLPIKKIYWDKKQRRKYPAMREMFHDPKLPLSTLYTVWLDDDSYCLNPQWLSHLADTILAQDPTQKVGMYGHVMLHPLKKGGPSDPRDWFRRATWYREEPFRTKTGGKAGNAEYIFFCTGGAWCVSTEAIVRCGIPDVRLIHNGGDVAIGAQLASNGYLLKKWNTKKEHLKSSDHARRGYHESFLWHRE